MTTKVLILTYLDLYVFNSLPKSLNLIHTVTIKKWKMAKISTRQIRVSLFKLLKVVPVKISSLKVAGAGVHFSGRKGTSANDTQKLTALHPRSESRRGSLANSGPVCHRM